MCVQVCVCLCVQGVGSTCVRVGGQSVCAGVYVCACSMCVQSACLCLVCPRCLFLEGPPAQAGVTFRGRLAGGAVFWGQAQVGGVPGAVGEGRGAGPAQPACSGAASLDPQLL